MGFLWPTTARAAGGLSTNRCSTNTDTANCTCTTLKSLIHATDAGLFCVYNMGNDSSDDDVAARVEAAVLLSNRRRADTGRHPNDCEGTVMVQALLTRVARSIASPRQRSADFACFP